MRSHYWTVIVPLIAGGLFIACDKDSEPDDLPKGSLTEDSAPGLSGQEALKPNATGWEDGGVDAVSSASILRVSRSTFGYIDKADGGGGGSRKYSVKLVDVNNPTTALEKEIPDGKNVALWTTGDGGKIIMVSADETGYEAFEGHEVVVYDQSLKVLNRFGFGNGEVSDAVPLHHRDPALAVTDKYAIAGWDSEEGGGTFISIYALSGGKTLHIKTTDEPVAFTGDITAFAAHGDYIIIGASAATKVFKIDNSGEDITLQLQAGDQTPGTHWMLDNQTYVLDCASGNGQVRVWKWNGNDAPAVTGSANVGASTGNVQAVSFDNDNAGIAYVFGRAAANEGDVYKIDLTNASAVKLFKVPRYAEDKAITGIWTIQAETRGDNKYFVFGGSIYAPARGQTGDSKHGVFWVKNPPSNGAEIADASIFDTISDFPTAVRTMKTFKASNGDVFYAAKNYTSNPIAEADYRLRLIKIDN